MSRQYPRGSDPLHVMRAYRHRMKPYVGDDQGDWGLHWAEQRMYRAHRQLAMRPVDLPSDNAHRMPSAETCAHFNSLTRAA